MLKTVASCMTKQSEYLLSTTERRQRHETARCVSSIPAFRVDESVKKSRSFEQILRRYSRRTYRLLLNLQRNSTPAADTSLELVDY